VSGSGAGTAESKIDALDEAGVLVGDTPEEVADNVEELL
jgi:succinyl-CoA synthetase alpha subunit